MSCDVASPRSFAHLTDQAPTNMHVRVSSKANTVPELSHSTRHLLRALSVLTVGVASVHAQTPRPTAAVPGEVRGRVVNAAGGNAIASATVQLIGVNDTITIVRGTARADGRFGLSGVRFGRYRVMARALGFAPRALTVTITAAAPIADVGAISLTVAATELQGLKIIEQAQRQVELAPDRNTYTVSDMPTTRGGNVIDVLRTVPSVDVDIDNIVSLRGNAGVIVQINGRPSPMKSAQLGNFLAQLPAAMVEKVEIIPNPSARDNPEGSAGIINIVLKKKTDVGSSGALTLAQGTTQRTDVGGNVGYQRGPLTFFGTYGFSSDRRPRSESLARINRYATPLTYLDQTGSRLQKPRSHTASSTLRYKPSKTDELSIETLFSTRHETGTFELLYHDLNSQRQLTGLRNRASDGIGTEDEFETTLGYTHKFPGDDHEFAAELRYVRASEGGPNAYRTQLLNLNGSPNGSPALETTRGGERPTDRSVQLDYVRPLGENAQFRTGYRGALKQIHTFLDTRTFDIATSAYVPDPTRTNAFSYDQLVNAAYGMVTGAVGRLNLQGGLRIEQADTRFELTRTATRFDNHYTSVYPSGLVSYRLSETEQLKLSYSTRIRRPDDPDQLDPTPHFQDPLNLSRGDPALKAEYIRAVELGLQRTTKRTTLQLTPFFRHTIDAVRRVRTIDGAGVTTTTFANVASLDQYGADATLALRGGKLTGFIGSSAFKQSSNASNLGPGISARGLGWSARTNAAYRFSRTFDMQALITYRARQVVEQGTNLEQTRFNFAVRQKLNRDRVSLTLRVTDPFSTEKERSITDDPRFYQTSVRFRRARGVLLNLTWMFGKPIKGQKGDEIDLTTGAS